MSNEKYNAAAAGLTLAAIDGAQMTIESLRKDREYVITLLAAAQQEIASLKVRVWQCGAGAGCCAQAARIKELEAQLEAVGAAPDGMSRREFGQFLSDVITAAGLVSHGKQCKDLGQRLGDAVMRLSKAPAADQGFGLWWTDHMPNSDKSEAWAEWCALRSTRLAPQQAAQAQDDAVAQAVAVEREACAQLAAQTVCDLHIPTGVKIYGSKAARAIRARDANAS